MSPKVKKVFNIVLNVLLVLFFVICLLSLILAVSARKSSDGATSIFGYQMRIVVSPSMEKCDAVDVSGYKIKSIPVKSMVFIQQVPEDEQKAQEWYSRLRVGDVLTFQYGSLLGFSGSDDPKAITHRIVDIFENENGGYTIILQGDNRESEDSVSKQTIYTERAAISTDYVIGKVTATSLALGVIVTGIRQPVGIVLLIIVPCAIIVIVEVIKVVEIFHSAKAEKAAEAEKQKTDEIEELKRQIAELRGQATSADPPASESSAPDGNDEE